VATFKRRNLTYTALPPMTPVTPQDYDAANREWRSRAPAELKNLLRAVRDDTLDEGDDVTR
jgi:hypothetical protein